MKSSTPGKRTNPCANKEKECKVDRKKRFVTCREGVVYRVPLSCGHEYIGQTGRCINSRLKEHDYNANENQQGHISLHCRRCGTESTGHGCSRPCVPLFDQSVVISRHKDQQVREIVEAMQATSV